MLEREIIEDTDNIKCIDLKSNILAHANISRVGKEDYPLLIKMFKEQEIGQIKMTDLDENSNLSDEEIIEEFSDNFKDIFSLEKTLNNLENLIIINYIESKFEKKGFGTDILNYIKSNYDGILLYPDVSAIDYWIKNGFKEVIYDDYYLYCKNISS